MKNLIFRTNNDWACFITRLTLAIVLFPHGAQKMLGLFGGYGFFATMDFLTATMHLPWIIAFIVIITEFVGSLALLTGFASRLWSALIIIIMSGAVITSHFVNGFFMNWYGNKKGEGFEFHLLIIGLALVIIIGGSGKYSIDNLFSNSNSNSNNQ